jgi:hypothetical protein
MRILAGIFGLCLASWLCFEIGSYSLVLGEGPAYFVWFGLLTIVGFLSGLLWPRSLVWGALFVTLSQSALLYEQLVSAGEIQSPSSSTGGKAGWMIVTTLLIMFSPVPALASWYGKCVRAKPAQHGAAADDRPQAGDRG